jgi:hypothetical protein
MVRTYLIAVLAGLIMYLVLFIDAKFIDTSKNENNISPKIPLFVTLMVWVICAFVGSESASPEPLMMTHQMMRRQF